MKILSVIGCRPNFMKLAPISHAVKKRDNVELITVHTGQHFDYHMSQEMLDQFGLKPQINLDISGGSHAEQTARMISGIENVVNGIKPDICLVIGDTNSTLAGALVASKLHVPVAHVEAGMRSFDRRMPEEVNRIIVDHLSDYLFCCSKDDRAMLIKEGVPAASCHVVGNTMFDCLKMFKKEISRADVPEWPYGILTIHRAENTDDVGKLIKILDAVMEIARGINIIFPIHPRTKKTLERCGYEIPPDSRLLVIEPMGYFQFMAHVGSAAFVITDSGGLQAETSYLDIPCYTIRSSTEHRWTLTTGTNHLMGDDLNGLIHRIRTVQPGHAGYIPGADGRASERILDILCQNN